MIGLFCEIIRWQNVGRVLLRAALMLGFEELELKPLLQTLVYCLMGEVSLHSGSVERLYCCADQTGKQLETVSEEQT